jgi:phosphoribosylaminoimidazolecarboxamide formyltransferase / IMP cyclohydrolase
VKEQRMDNLIRPKRALISVSDKTNIVAVASQLAASGVEIISTGGTQKALALAGLKVIEVSDFTGFPEMMDGRVKTLHPKVHGGLLAVRTDLDHQAMMHKHDIKPIDILIVNLYPFEETVKRGASFADCIENIDIGGPAMIRGAAKNHKEVLVLVDPNDYEAFLQEFASNKGATSESFRRKLAAKAYQRTGAYDTAIGRWFATKI